MNAIEAAKEFGGNIEDWREMDCGAVVHKDATIGPLANIEGPVIIRGGTINGGTIHGGIIRGGTINGGTIWGGSIWGGTIHGGIIRGGTINGGTIWGGIIHDGTIHGGVIRGGDIHDTPLQLEGILPWFVNVSAPGRLQIGCEDHSIETWRTDLNDLAKKHNATQYLSTLRLAIEIAQNQENVKWDIRQ